MQICSTTRPVISLLHLTVDWAREREREREEEEEKKGYRALSCYHMFWVFMWNAACTLVCTNEII